MTIPESDLDLWSDQAILDPYPGYRELRDTAPAVWLTRYGMAALARYTDVRDALVHWDPFSSAHGVMMNDHINQALRGIMLCSDPPEHSVLRGVARRPLLPRELKLLEHLVTEEADSLVAQLAAKGSFDAATDLAQHLPITIVSKLVGLPEEGREQMLDWARANFNCFGPMNARTEQSLPVLQDAIAYSTDPTLRQRLKPGGWADQLYAAADAGEIPAEQAGIMLNDYWAPSLDTTIMAIGSAIRLFAEHPDQWDLVRADPRLVSHAINEVLRLESPIQMFSRLLTSDYQLDGSTLPQGQRVVIVFASANRDERKWADPGRFDVLRKPADHIAFGWGEHQCMGMSLARLEMRALLTALASRVHRFEITAMEPLMNNVLHGPRKLEVSIS
jgi:cytochrome P450